MELLVEVRDLLYHHEARFIQYIQENHSYLSGLLQEVSKLADPAMGFTFYFPLLLALDRKRGIGFIAAFIVSEWLNLNLKWILHGDRPYWWVQEVQQNITVVQTPLTCETGPGVPSGHCQAAAVVSYSLLDILTLATPLRPFLFLPLFLPAQLLTLLSRIFISAHFPHQCLAGLLVGLAALHPAYQAGRVNLLSARPAWLLILWALLLPASSLAVYGGLQALGLDPSWSVAQARRYCAQPAWVYVDTTPFYALVRFGGAGLSLAAVYRLYWRQPQRCLTGWGSKVAQLIIGLMIGALTVRVNALISRTNPVVFYSLELGLNALNVGAIVVVPHHVVSVMYHSVTDVKLKK